MYDLSALMSEIHDTIPLTRAMAPTGLRYDGSELLIELPLAPNVNDKGCAFGGSLLAAATVAGWGLVRLAMGESGRRADIYVQDSQSQFLKPAWSSMLLRAGWQPGARADFLAQFDARGKARVSLQVIASSDEVECFRMQARYVAMRQAR